MDGFTVSNANRFLQTGQIGDRQSLSISNNGMSQSEISHANAGSQKSFADTLNDAIQSVNTMQKQADVGMQNLATGRTDNVAEVMITAEKADIALKLMVQVRNKIIDAYQEIMRMQV